jgi:hypothetical protein
MAGKVREIGAAFVRLFAKSDTLERDLDKAEKSVEQSTAKMEASAKKVGSGFKGAGDNIERSTEGLRKFSGAISSTVGIATGLVGAFTGIVGVIGLIVAAWREFNKEVEPTQEQIAGLGRQLAVVVEQVNKLRGDPVSPIDSPAVAAAREQVLKAQENVEKLRKLAEDARASWFGIIGRSLPGALGGGPEQQFQIILDRLSQAEGELVRARNNLNKNIEKESLERRKENEGEIAKYRNSLMEAEADRRLQMYREIEEQREQARMEAEKKSGRVDAERERDRKIEQLVKSLNDNTRALEDNTKVSRGAFGFDVNTLDRLAAAIEGSA